MTPSNEFKIFWDAVHGQIKISNILCKQILDTEHFQRLKRLEQTNARPLYPCAHHDRFIHSLGTYHLGRFTFKSIKKNSKNYIKKFAEGKRNTNPISWGTLGYEFSLACLLHDVGHAPFSHTFEEFFNVDLNENNNNILDNFLLNKNKFHKYKTKSYISEFKSFKKDYKLAISGETISSNGRYFKVGSNPKEHEKVSAYLVLKQFQEVIKNSFTSSPFNIVRMILGIKFSEGFENSAENIKYQIYNCFIELLNGEEIDVDKIDYLIRDQWATGNVFRHIDCSRLLSSIYILEDKETGLLFNFFHKKSINEIIGLKETKHNITANTHSHPIVKYDDHILKKAVNEVIKIEIENCKKLSEKDNTYVLSEENKENYISKIVSVDALIETISFSNSRIYLPTDDDLVHYLKKNITESPYAREWLSRDYRLKALWKTPFDFNFHFSELEPFEKKVLYKEVENITKRFLKSCTYLNNIAPEVSFYLQKKGLQEYKVFKLKSNLNILLNIKSLTSEKLSKLLNNDRINAFDKTSETETDTDTDTYFILYLPSPFVNKKFEEDRYNERLEFFAFAIREVKSYVNKFEIEILSNLEKNPRSSPSEIAKLSSSYIDCESDIDKNEFEETIKLLLIHLLNSKKIDCNNYNINPKKRKFFIADTITPALSNTELSVNTN